MSHRLITKISQGAFDRTVLDRACERLGYPKSVYAPAPGYNIEGTTVEGATVKIPTFEKLAVFNDGPVLDPRTRRPMLDSNGNPLMEVQCHFDNWTPRGYVDKAPLDALQKAYNDILDEDTRSMVEEAREIAHRNNQMTAVSEEADGVIVLEVQLA